MRLGRTASWIPLYLVFALAVTLSPFWLTCRPQPFRLELHAGDFLRNALLFAPLGAGLGRWRLGRVILAAALLSGGIELVQRWLPREPNAWDLLANVSGAVLGRGAARSLGSIRPIRWPILAGLAVVALSCVLVLRAGLAPNDLSTWEPYPLILGNEFTGDRPWRGTLKELSFYDRALERDPDPQSLPPGWDAGGPILWMRFGPGVSGRLDGPQGSRPFAPEAGGGSLSIDAEGLHMEGARWVLPEAASRHVYDRIKATGRFAIVASLSVEDLTRSGPARIVSMSRNPKLRSFTLGQQRGDLDLRVRTRHTSRNGTGPSLRTGDQPLTSGIHAIRGVFGGSFARIFVDGRCRGDLLYPAVYAHGPLGVAIGGTIVLCAAFGGLACAGLAGGSPGRRGVALVTGGAAALGVLRLAGVWDHFPGFDLRATIIGAAALLACATLVAHSPPDEA